MSTLLSICLTTDVNRILLVKTSSLGDVLHNLPIVSDIRRHYPALQIDWVVEESFAALPALHPGVQQVVPVAIRRWRKSWLAYRPEIKRTCALLRSAPYDLVLDTQGLLKSALISRCAQAPAVGYGWASAREPIASLFYSRRYSVARQQHAVERNRQLAAAALGYRLDGPAHFGLKTPDVRLDWLGDSPYAVLLHATSRDDKLWDESRWVQLGRHLQQAGMRCILPWGNPVEHARAERLAAQIPAALCAPRLDLKEAAALLGKARAVVGVDTGLSHLAAALDVPTIGLYTATDPGLTGLYPGPRCINLGGKGLSPSVDEVLQTLERLGIHV